MDTSILIRIGDQMADGSIFAGISPDTDTPIYTTPEDVFLEMNWHRATFHAKNLIAHGHLDWRLPTPAELNVLFLNRIAIGRFNARGLPTSGWYWSSAEYDYFQARDQRFSDGLQSVHTKRIESSVRCVRVPLSP